MGVLPGLPGRAAGGRRWHRPGDHLGGSPHQWRRSGCRDDVVLRPCRRFLSTAESRAAVALTLTGMAMPVTVLAYSESIALLLLMLLFTGLAARSYWWVALTILALSLTRPVVAALAVVFVVCAIDAWRRRSSTGVSPWPWVGLTIWASVCAFIWPTVASISTGNWSTYWDTEAAYQEPGMARSWLVVGRSGYIRSGWS